MTEGKALYSLGVRSSEKNGKRGLTLPIPGKPEETIFLEASDKKPDCIVASSRKQDRVKDATQTRCHNCRCQVWISPSTQELLKRYPETPVICLACFMHFMQQAEEEKEGNQPH